MLSVRGGRDGGRKLLRVDVAPGARRDDADATAVDRELSVVRADDPMPEARTHDARERVRVERDREPMAVHADLERASELRRRE